MTKDENCNVADGFVNCGNGNYLQCNGQGRGIEQHKLIWFVDLFNIYLMKPQNIVAKIVYLK